MRFDNVLKTLKEFEAKSQREGYRGDATSYAFKRYVLILLSKLVEQKKGKKRRTTAWQRFVGEYWRQGKTIEQASEDWKKKKK